MICAVSEARVLNAAMNIAPASVSVITVKTRRALLRNVLRSDNMIGGLRRRTFISSLIDQPFAIFVVEAVFVDRIVDRDARAGNDRVQRHPDRHQQPHGGLQQPDVRGQIDLA